MAASRLWDELSEAEKAAAIRNRKLKGHCSVAEYQRMREEAVIERTFNAACDTLNKLGYFEASNALADAIFEQA